MFKVSFDKKNYKEVRNYNDKVTQVTIKGEVHWPEELVYFPTKWLKKYKQVNYDIPTDTVTATGIAKCADTDTYDPVIGERIAEARAKIKLYKFMYRLCCHIMYHFDTLCYGGPVTLISEIDATAQQQEQSVSGTILKYLNLYEAEEDHLDKLLSL